MSSLLPNAFSRPFSLLIWCSSYPVYLPLPWLVIDLLFPLFAEDLNSWFTIFSTEISFSMATVLATVHVWITQSLGPSVLDLSTFNNLLHPNKTTYLHCHTTDIVTISDHITLEISVARIPQITHSSPLSPSLPLTIPSIPKAGTLSEYNLVLL